jgi:hypothetical protein
MNKQTAEWLIPLCHFAADWHNGHGRVTRRDRREGERVSYRLLSLAMMAAKRRGVYHPLEPMTVKQKLIYRHLEETYIPAEWREK